MIDILNSEYHFTFYLFGSVLFYYTFFFTNLVLTAYNEKYLRLDEDKL